MYLISLVNVIIFIPVIRDIFKNIYNQQDHLKTQMQSYSLLRRLSNVFHLYMQYQWYSHIGMLS